MDASRAWNQAKGSAYLYRVLSDAESGTARQLLFLELAQQADQQAIHWAAQAPLFATAYAPDRRVKAAAWLINKIGPHYASPLLAALKIGGLSVYDHRYHLLQMPPPVDGNGKTAYGKIISGNLRAVLFGVQEGVFALLLLVLGMAGAVNEFGAVLLTGISGLLAGALCLAAWEYRSVQALRRVMAWRSVQQLDQSAQYPWEETQALAGIYQARGMGRAEAWAQAKKMLAEFEVLDEPAARCRLRLTSPGTPRQEAAHAFFAFLLGGLLPLAPYLFNARHHPLLAAIAVSALGLLVAGAAVSWVIGRQPLWGAFRLLGISALAGLAAYGVGRWLGVLVL